jgi:hypothetical protein
MSNPRIRDAVALDRRIDAAVAKARAVAGELATAESHYAALVARAANGDDPPETAWRMVESRIELHHRQLARCKAVLEFQGAAVLAQTADLPLAHAVPAGRA